MTTRQRLALTAYQQLAYDVALASTLAHRLESLEKLPQKCYPRNSWYQGAQQALRYGENPINPRIYHRNTIGEPPTGLAAAVQHGGKDLSFNNYLDLDAPSVFVVLTSARMGRMAHCCVIIKHTNACGVAISTNQVAAWDDALSGDHRSAFGCVIAFNTPVTKSTAERIGDHFVE